MKRAVKVTSKIANNVFPSIFSCLTDAAIHCSTALCELLPCSVSLRTAVPEVAEHRATGATLQVPPSTNWVRSLGLGMRAFSTVYPRLETLSSQSVSQVFTVTHSLSALTDDLFTPVPLLAKCQQLRKCVYHCRIHARNFLHSFPVMELQICK